MRPEVSWARLGPVLEPSGAVEAIEPPGLSVRGGLPGEEVALAVDHESGRGRRFAHVRAVHQPSADRVPVACPHFLDCGGCDLLHVAYPRQLEEKRRFVAAALGLDPADVRPTLPSPAPLGYRAFAKLVVGPGGALGSYRPHSHEVVDMAGCVVHRPEIEAVAARVRVRLPEAPGLRYVLVRVAADGAVLVTLVSPSLDDPLGPLVDALAAEPRVVRVDHQANASTGNALLEDGAPARVLLERGEAFDDLGGVRVALGSAAFAQVNPGAAARLYEVVARELDVAGRRVVDLYSGTGGLALTLGRAGALAVTGVERAPAAVLAGRRAAVVNGLDQVELVAGRAEDAPIAGAERLSVNPPRRGLHPEVRAKIAAHPPRRLAYVSCNPSSLSADLAVLAPLGRVLLVQPADFFPQTRHVEVLVVMEFS